MKVTNDVLKLSGCMQGLFEYEIKENLNDDIAHNLNVNGETARAETDANQTSYSSPVEEGYLISMCDYYF